MQSNSIDNSGDFHGSSHQPKIKGVKFMAQKYLKKGPHRVTPALRASRTQIESKAYPPGI